MNDPLAHLFAFDGYLPAILITLGVATLVGCAVGCVCFLSKGKEDLFHRDVQ